MSSSVAAAPPDAVLNDACFCHKNTEILLPVNSCKVRMYQVGLIHNIHAGDPAIHDPRAG